MARDYGKPKRERAPLLMELYSLGLSSKAISECTKWSLPTIANDVRDSGWRDTYANRPNTKEDIFQHALVRFARTQYGQDGERFCEVDQEDVAIRDALSIWLREDLIIASLSGVAHTVDQLLDPAYPLEKKLSVRLLGAIFGHGMGRHPRDCAEAWRFDSIGATGSIGMWLGFLSRISNGSYNSDKPFELVPVSRGHVTSLIVLFELDRCRADIMPIWDNDAFSFLELIIKMLSPREILILNERYGLDGPQKTMEQVGQGLGLSRERVRQLEARALKKLRAEAEGTGLDILVKPVGNALQREFGKREKAIKAMEYAIRIASDPHMREVLATPLADVVISVRTDNCLRRADILTIGELVQWTPELLLKVKYFGRKSLNEVKELLDQRGLVLGTALGPNLLALMRERSEALRVRV